MDVRAMWEADRQRTERVRTAPGAMLDALLSDALGDPKGEWWDAFTNRTVALAALDRLSERHPDRLDAFAQRLLDEVAPWATSYDSAIELTRAEMPTNTGVEGGNLTVLRILRAQPAAIMRAIILALPERET